MRIAILHTVYDAVLRQLYDASPGLVERPYADQLAALCGLGFGHADFAVLNLKRLGHEASEFFVLSEPLQRSWAREHGLRLPSASGALGKFGRRVSRGLRKRVGLLARNETPTWVLRVTASQVEEFRPDMILNCTLPTFPDSFLRQLKRDRRLLVGQCAYPIPWDEMDLSPYDLMVSAAPNYVERSA